MFNQESYVPRRKRAAQKSSKNGNNVLSDLSIKLVKTCGPKFGSKDNGPKLYGPDRRYNVFSPEKVFPVKFHKFLSSSACFSTRFNRG